MRINAWLIEAARREGIELKPISGGSSSFFPPDYFPPDWSPGFGTITPGAVVPVTGGDVITSVLLQLGEDPLAPVFWDRAELLQYLNDGLLELDLMTCKFQSETTFAPTTESILQTTPSTAIAVMHVSNGREFLRKRTLEGMDREDRSWMKRASGSIIKQWGPVGLNLFFIFPKIALAFIGSTITLLTLDPPPVIGEATAIPLDEEYISALEYYVFHMARFKEGGVEFQQSLDAYQQFRVMCGELGKRRMSEQYALWAKEPAQDTGSRYATIPRS